MDVAVVALVFGMAMATLLWTSYLLVITTELHKRSSKLGKSRVTCSERYESKETYQIPASLLTACAAGRPRSVVDDILFGRDLDGSGTERDRPQNEQRRQTASTVV